jgi:hypothetical protein
MEPIKCPETSANIYNTLGNNLKTEINYSVYDESLKSTVFFKVLIKLTGKGSSVMLVIVGKLKM